MKFSSFGLADPGHKHLASYFATLPAGLYAFESVGAFKCRHPCCYASLLLLFSYYTRSVSLPTRHTSTQSNGIPSSPHVRPHTFNAAAASATFHYTTDSYCHALLTPRAFSYFLESLTFPPLHLPVMAPSCITLPMDCKLIVRNGVAYIPLYNPAQEGPCVVPCTTRLPTCTRALWAISSAWCAMRYWRRVGTRRGLYFRIK